MSRNNIFELMKEKYDYMEEVSKLIDLLEESMITYNGYDDTLEEFVDEYEFDNWKHSYHYLNCKELKTTLNINHTIFLSSRGCEISTKDILIYIEYILNIVYICEKSIAIVSKEAFFSRPYPRLRKNIEILRYV